MCFAIPYKILKISKGSALIEGGKTVRLGKEIKAKEGDYLQVVGSLAVCRLTNKEGLKVRKLIKSLNQYE